MIQDTKFLAITKNHVSFGSFLLMWSIKSHCSLLFIFTFYLVYGTTLSSNLNLFIAVSMNSKFDETKIMQIFFSPKFQWPHWAHGGSDITINYLSPSSIIKMRVKYDHFFIYFTFFSFLLLLLLIIFVSLKLMTYCAYLFSSGLRGGVYKNGSSSLHLHFKQGIRYIFTLPA